MRTLISAFITTVLIAAAAVDGTCFFSSSDIGTTGVPFLKLGTGARAAAMGGAMTAVSADANSVYWNPAGLGLSEYKQISFMHVAWFEEVNYENVSLVCPIISDGALGLSFDYVTIGDINRYTNTGERLEETFSANDTAVTLAYSTQLDEYIPVGVSVKYISSLIDTYRANTFACDFGALYTAYKDTQGLTFGAVVQNLGKSIQFIRESDMLPLQVKLGVSYEGMLSYAPVTVTGDVIMPSDNDISVALGAEYSVFLGEDIALYPRIGYRSGVKGLDTLAHFSTGFGFTRGLYSFDYALVPYGELGLTHRAAFSIKF